MRLQANTSVYALAGSIAYARNDLDTAVRHFDSAFEMDRSNCVAASSAGLVHIDRRAWHPAADRYSKATDCFALAANTARADVARLEQSALEPGLTATRLSSARKRIESAEELGGQSALTAAQSYVHTGQNGLALTFIERAERHPATRADALALRARIASRQ
jgi:tetratricopeptide (TPR) repeat protein